MLYKVLILFSVLVLFIFIESRLLKKHIVVYHPLLWGLVELFWYMISFGAVCIGLAELERIEKLNIYKQNEKALTEDYFNKKNLLSAQVWILQIDSATPENEVDGVLWFHKMKGLFDEGMFTNRWEGFLTYSRSYIFKEPGIYANAASNAVEFGWPKNSKLRTDNLFLKDEIKWVVDSLKTFKVKKDRLSQMKPEENTNYKIRYILIFFFLIGLSLKILKIYADYKRASIKK
jgi:hypothetical protein